MGIDLSDMQARLKRLEAQAWRRRVLDMVVGAVGGVVLVGILGNVRAAKGTPAAGSFETVEAREFMLRDARGVVRARLAAPEEASGPVGHGDPVPRKVGHNAFLALYDGIGEHRLELGVGPDGTAGLIVTSARGQTVALSAGDMASISLRSGGEQRASLSAFEGAAGSAVDLTFVGPGREVVRLGVGPGESGALTMIKNNRTRLVLGEAKAAKVGAQMTPLPDGYYLHLFDESGHLVSRTPSGGSDPRR